MTDINNADENLKKFLEKHGTEGFLKLFFSNYLFDLVDYYLQTKGTSKDNDPGYLFYFNLNGEPESLDKIEKFRMGLKQTCLDHAKTIVDSLKQSYNIEESATDPIDKNSQALLDSAFEKIIKKFDE